MKNAITQIKNIIVEFLQNSYKINSIDISFSTMKKFAVVLFVLLTSCENIFHEVDNPYLNIDTDQEKINMINGIYTRLVEVHNPNYFTVLSRSDDVHNFEYIYYESIMGDILVLPIPLNMQKLREIFM